MIQALDKTLRGQLEGTVKKARNIAETAAQTVLDQIGIGAKIKPTFLNEEQQKLRVKLRAHARSLGDIRKPDGTQEIERLTEEVAYEHWHRMLFARFLAENSLLMYPDPEDPVAITLEECEDMAVDEGASNGWELAGRYASQMLPQIFRIDSPVLALEFAADERQQLEKLVFGLPEEVFQASDSLGWVYQFWQAKRKDEVNKSEVKIGARELPAVTQLFTEPYMVDFLLDNSLGAWWAAQRLSAEDWQQASSEQELRDKASIPNVPLNYLRFVQDDKGVWSPAAGTFPDWPEQLAELKTLDPCCGSGHFLVAALLMLAPMRMELEGLGSSEAIDAVLEQNLHGLELDQRCVELAAFALALEAWRYPDAGGYRSLPELNIACSGLSIQAAKEEWKQLAMDKQSLRIALDWLHESFKDAPVLGSLLNPAKTNAAKVVEWDELAKVLEQALDKEHSAAEQEAAVVAQGITKAAKLLAAQYQWVITNVPYLSRNKQSSRLKTFCEVHYPAGKNDLATVFLDRCLELCVEGGTSSVVLPQNWLFLTSYQKIREKLLKSHQWHLIARLGAGAFDTINGEVVKAILITLSRGSLYRDSNIFGALNKYLIRGIDVSEKTSPKEKALSLIDSEVKTVEQAKQLDNPDSRITLEKEVKLPLLNKYTDSYQGITTGDNLRFIFMFWEMKSMQFPWKSFQSVGNNSIHYSGKEQVFLWEDGLGYLAGSDAARIQGQTVWGEKGVAVRQMRELPCTLNLGSPWDMNCATIVPNNPDHLPAIWCFCSSPEYNEAVRQIDQSLKVTNATLAKVPFDLDHWTKIAKEKYPNGLPQPYSEDPTQWIFHGNPSESTDSLQVAVARLLGYRWPAETDAEMELSDHARELIRANKPLALHTDEDGIVCIPPIRGEALASDRLISLLADAYGDQWSTTTLNQLLAEVGQDGKTLDFWLKNKFFEQHCKLFHNRPFIWHVWDGLNDGFAALVNYHKFDQKLLETLIYTYLGDWIRRQKQEIQAGVDGAEERLAAAEGLHRRLLKILKGEEPLDIFVRWKPLEEQPIGWNPDLNDGVRMNIRPFIIVEDIKIKNAGVLRNKLNVKWGKDRGKDVETAPWYAVFDGERINDHHLSLEEKQDAREAMEKDGA